jgi:type IV secretory pathway VirB10-like protein
MSDKSASSVSVSASAIHDVSARELTYGTKIDADDPRLKIEQPRSGRILKTKRAVGALCAIVVGVALTVISALGEDAAPATKETAEAPEAQAAVSQPVPIPEVIANPPAPEPAADEAPPAAAPPKLGPPLEGNVGHGAITPPADGQGPLPTGASPQTAEAERRKERLEMAQKGRASALFFNADDASFSDRPTTPPPRPAFDPTAHIEQTMSALQQATRGAAGGGMQGDQNMQGRKNDFLSKTGGSDSTYLKGDLEPPRSPYEVKAGHIIPVVLITGINSDLPGNIIGRVRENVYDTVTGNYLLIPQGSTLLAAYDSMVAFGQERILVCWNRLIRPDGTSINLECMPGVDRAGYAGFADQVDHHWWRVLSGVALGSLLAATTARSQGDVQGYNPSFPQAWASNAASQINQAGQALTQKNIQIQPTITIRPGFSVNVLVTKDMVLEPVSQTR